MIPLATRRAVLKRANGHCEQCGHRERLELHHLYYRTDGDMYSPDGVSIVGREEPDDLVALCRECHLSRHVDMAGNFWADPVEREQYWAPYWEEMERG